MDLVQLAKLKKNKKKNQNLPRQRELDMRSSHGKSFDFRHGSDRGLGRYS